MLFCPVCNSNSFSYKPVIWDELANQWQLTPSELEYINKQQGMHCTQCHSNMRSMALALALKSYFKTLLPLNEFANSDSASTISLLEINEAGSLTPILSKMPKHIIGRYPDVDMHNMNFPNESFDLVVHSDTLEHVEHPIRALAECRRILKSGGALCFTIPILVGRMTRNRKGLQPSYHGPDASDLLVHTEFGVDAWTYLMQAGFSNISITSLDYPTALAWTAWQ